VIYVGDRVRAVPYSTLETMLMSLGVATWGTVAVMGSAGDVDVLFDGQCVAMTVALMDLELDPNSAVSNAQLTSDPWFDAPSAPKRKERKCDCGAAKAKTTHAFWCSLNDEDTKPN